MAAIAAARAAIERIHGPDGYNIGPRARRSST
jgi:hypothetical protein